MGKIKIIPAPNSSKRSERQRLQIHQALLDAEINNGPVDLADQFPVPVYQTGLNTKQIIHPNKPSAITLGNSREYQTKSQINIVAGTLGAALAENNPQTGEPVKVAYPTPFDAASVVVTEMEDYGFYNARSTVKAKADIVSLGATELVEIKAGGIPYLSNGHAATNKYGSIHLIAGGSVEGKDFDLQPLVKGDNLTELIKDLTGLIQNLTQEIGNLNKDVVKLKSSLITHTHSVTPFSPITPVQIALPPLETLGFALPPTMAKTNAIITTNLASIDYNISLVKQNYLEPNSPVKISSRFNKVN